MKRYENLEKAMCRELETLDRKYSTEVEMSDKDLERADKLLHALKSNETYFAMKEAHEYDERYGGMSERRYSMGYPEDGYSRHWGPRDRIDPYRPW